MKKPVAPLWLFCVVAVATTATLIHNTRARVTGLSDLEYAAWVDGQVYSMASWRFWTTCMSAWRGRPGCSWPAPCSSRCACPRPSSSKASNAESKQRLEEMLSPVLTLAAATLALPVFLTTAGGIETQTFALTHFLGLSLLVQWAWASLDTSMRPAPGTNPE